MKNGKSLLLPKVKNFTKKKLFIPEVKKYRKLLLSTSRAILSTNNPRKHKTTSSFNEDLVTYS